ncbi:F-box protein At4g22390-like [Corylus avellana]|uniref:F-box protein At4g22390-like n=1 Tax=Corylus avellana TaxID=13451 RepID=UPI00286A0D06|nr:F-box protein At4g22390-like [Corylus avellana]
MIKEQKIKLPPDLITHIFSLLPINSLLRFQCVSKSCLALITDPYLINMSLDTSRERSLIVETSSRHRPKDYYLVNFSDENRLGESTKIYPPFHFQKNLNQTSMIGCCNMLVCIFKSAYLDPYGYYGSKYDNKIVIWNPSIKKNKKLPNEPHLDYDKHNQLITTLGYNPVELNLAFGFDPVNNDYKVLKIVFARVVKADNWGLEPPWTAEIMEPLEIMVYSLKAHSWKRVEDQWPYKEESFIWSGPAFSNGAFYWLVNSALGSTTLLTFDLTTEKFGLQTFPFESYFNVTLEVLGGLLCVSKNTHEGVEVWMMEYGVTSNWSRLYTVPMTFPYHRSLAFSEDGEKILMEDNSRELFWFHIEKKTWYKIIENARCPIFNMNWTAPYVESILLIDGDSDN